MKWSIISFTENGKQLSEKIAKLLKEDREDEETQDIRTEVCLYTKGRACGSDTVRSVKISIEDWVKEQMQAGNVLLFIGACGIAVRGVAPSLKDKLQDVPVLVMDEKGRYVIPILSGHAGGANELALQLGEKTGAEPVITTATDIHHKFAVDVFAGRNGLFIVNREGIAKVSSKVLAGERITISVEPGHGVSMHENGSGEKERNLPEEVRLVPYPPTEAVDVVITSEDAVFRAALLLKPREYIIGIGCKKGKSAEEIHDFITEQIKRLGIPSSRIYALSSISLKSGEQGIWDWCRAERIPFLTYTASQLQEVKGTFTGSSFVKAQTGVDNVCERAALIACGEGGRLVSLKHAKNGMTMAVAKRKWKVCFDEK